MATGDVTVKRVLLYLLKDFSRMHTITTMAKELGLSRVGMWKVIKKLDGEKYVVLKTIGGGKTSASLINLNWENSLLEKALSLHLTEEALKLRRWQVNFAELENVTNFVILYGSILKSSQRANDVDILGIAPRGNFVKIHQVIDNVQKTQSKEIHSLNFTKDEFKTELKKPNKAFVDAIKKGVILFGQDKFVQFMREMLR